MFYAYKQYNVWCKKDGESDFAENPKSKKKKNHFKKKPQWESDLVCIQIISKGRVTNLNRRGV